MPGQEPRIIVQVHFIGGVVASSRHSDWITFVVAGLLAVASGDAAIRVWRGEPSIGTTPWIGSKDYPF